MHSNNVSFTLEIMSTFILLTQKGEHFAKKLEKYAFHDTGDGKSRTKNERLLLLNTLNEKVKFKRKLKECFFLEIDRKIQLPK